MKGSIFWIGISIIILSWIGNYLFFQSKQLDAPLFLEHYYETSINKEEEILLPFYYITNKSDLSTVSYVIINGTVAYPESTVHHNMWDSNTNTPQFEQEFTHHYLKSVYISLPTNLEDELWDFTEMDVHFSDLKTVQADIGHVIVKKTNPNPFVLDSRMSGSSNQHFNQETLLAKQPMTVDKIVVPFEELSDDVLMKVDREQSRLSELDKLVSGGDHPTWFNEDSNKEWEDLPGELVGDDLFPFNLKKDEWIRLLMQFNPDRNSYFQFSVKIIGKTDSGEAFINETPISDHPSLTQKSINKIIESKERGEVH